MLKAHLHACVGGREAERGRVRGGESDKERERERIEREKKSGCEKDSTCNTHYAISAIG